MTALPSGWASVPLGELVEAARPRVNPRDADGLQFIGMDHVESQTMRLLGTVPASTMKSAAVQFEPGDVLYGRLRPYLNKVYRPDFPGLGSAEFIVLTPSERLDGEYLRYLLNSSDFVRFATGLNTGDRPRVDFKQLGRYPVPLPRLVEQKRIVGAIEQQLSRIEVAHAALARSLFRIRRLRASILGDAWRSFGQASAAKTLAQLSRGGDYGTSQKATHEADGPPILRIPNVARGRLLLADLKFATRSLELDSGKALQPGDFLIVRTNGSRDLIGRGAVVESSFETPHFHASYLIRFRLLGDAELWRWISLLWSAPGNRAILEAMAATSAGQYNLNLRSLSGIRIPVPSADYLSTALAMLEERLTVVDEMAEEVRRSTARAAALRRSVLHQAFIGQIQ